MNGDDDIMADLRGKIYLTKRLRLHAVWNRDPMSYGQAWVHLLLLANDRDRVVNLNGTDVSLKRGQLAWSIRRLEIEVRRSVEWVERFLKFCKDEAMITVESGRRGTVITILNYELYNVTGTDSGSDSGTDSGSDSGTDSGSEPEQKVEVGSRSKKGEAPAPEMSLIPSDEEVRAFCADFQDLARGITGIPEVWWSGWLADKLGNGRPFPKDWRRVMKLAFTGDWASKHPKAVGPTSSPENKKNAAASTTGGRSVAQARFMLDKELEQVKERLDAAYEMNLQPSAADAAREKELEKQIRELVQTNG